MKNSDIPTLPVRLAAAINCEIRRGIEKWGDVDRNPVDLLAAATEELGEVAHGINHNEGKNKIQQEIAELMGILTRLYLMVE